MRVNGKHTGNPFKKWEEAIRSFKNLLEQAKMVFHMNLAVFRKA